MRLFFNNYILTQSTIFLPVFSKYVLSRIRNIFIIEKNKQWFEYLHKYSIVKMHFWKVKQTWTRIRKKTLEGKKNWKTWFLQRLIRRVKVYLQLMFLTCTIETVKTYISIFLLLANLGFQVVTILVETLLLLHISHTLTWN